MRILYVNPCIRENAPTKQPPVGLAYVMTYAHSQGYTNFDLLDIDINDYDDEYVEAYIKTHAYDVILFGCIVTHYKWSKWFVKMVKQHRPATRVIVGNSVAGSIHEIFLKNIPADVAVIGEGEFTTVDTLDCFRTNGDLSAVAGIAFLGNDGTVVKTPKRTAAGIDAIPMVNWDFFDIQKYIEKSSFFLSVGVDGEAEKKVIALPVCTARGCVFRCTFCHFVFWDDPFRFRSPENILAEIRRNQERYGMNYVAFWDDLSFSTVAQVEKLCDAIIESGLKFNWMATIRCDLFGREKLSYERRLSAAKKMKESGCLSVGTALESGNAEILKMMDKHIETQHYLDTVKMLRDVGIVVNISVVFGYPIETRESIQETFDLCLQTRVYPSIGFLMPLPYTGMYTYAKEHGFITDDDAYLDSITERQDICINMTKMTHAEIMESIKEGGRRLNELLQLGLTEDRFIRSGGDKKRLNLNKLKHHRDRDVPLDPDNIERNKGDFSFNYSENVFEVDSGVR